MNPAAPALLLVLAVGCQRSATEGVPSAAPPTSAPLPAPSAAASASPSSLSSPALQVEDAGGSAVVMVRRDGGSIAAARAERVLHVGDSMVPLVGFYLRKLYQADGRKYSIVAEDSSSTLSWDNERKLQEQMFKYDPDLILISLGSNELFDRNPERRAGAIRRLVKDTRGRPCLWIGPPAWKKDYGFLKVLKDNLGHCQYFDSTRLKLPRMKDGRHPSWTGGYRWSVAVWKRLGGKRPVPTGSARPAP